VETLSEIQERTFARATATTKGSYPPEDRLTEDELRAFLRRRAFAVVTSTRPDGRPHAAISSFACAGTTFWLPTGAGTVRERNIAAQPWVSLVITDGDRGEHISVIAEGPAEVVSAAVVPPQARADAAGQWATRWIRLQTQRLLSYASGQARARLTS
jgi:hypothetical protein